MNVICKAILFNEHEHEHATDRPNPVQSPRGKRQGICLGCGYSPEKNSPALEQKKFGKSIFDSGDFFYIEIQKIKISMYKRHIGS